MKPLADMMAKDSKCRWGNLINIVVLPLSIGLETDPLVYLSKAKSTMDQKKNSLHAPILYLIMSFIVSVFGAKVYKNDRYTRFLSAVRKWGTYNIKHLSF